MRKCPKCRKWTLDFDPYFSRFRCLDPECGWMLPSSAERAIRLLQRHRQPTQLQPVTVPDLQLCLAPSYDEESDAFSVDFGVEESTFDLPEADGRMVWRIGRHSSSVAGFTIVGVREGAISKITIDFIVERKGVIESLLQRLPESVKRRVTRDLVEEIIVTATCEEEPLPTRDPRLKGAWEEVVSRVKELTNN